MLIMLHLSAGCYVQHPPILMDVTLWPHAFEMTPMLLAVTPFPNPLTTPPVTSTYFIASAAAFSPEPSLFCGFAMGVRLLCTQLENSR